MGAGGWGSLLPAVWSFMLALPRTGLGSAWTTIHLMNDGEQQAAELLGIPFDKVSQGGLFPIAYTIGTDFKPAKREPLDEILHWDRGRSSSRRSGAGIGIPGFHFGDAGLIEVVGLGVDLLELELAGEDPPLPLVVLRLHRVELGHHLGGEQLERGADVLVAVRRPG